MFFRTLSLGPLSTAFPTTKLCMATILCFFWLFSFILRFLKAVDESEMDLFEEESFPYDDLVQFRWERKGTNKKDENDLVQKIPEYVTPCIIVSSEFE